MKGWQRTTGGLPQIACSPVRKPTVEVYDERGLRWAATHQAPGRRTEAEAFARRVEARSLRIDVGCGGGRYTAHLGTPLIGFDASTVMLAQCRTMFPGALYVQGDIEALPFARASIGGAWSWMTHMHVPRSRLPLSLWDLHRVLTVGAPFELQVLASEYEGDALVGDEVVGRFFAGWHPDDLLNVMVGAGFRVEPGSLVTSGDELRLRAVRIRTLADVVGPGMRLLVCGLNPSLRAADAGVGFAGPGNRFWPAALAAGLISVDRDPTHALAKHGIGMTDQVKRATRAVDELTTEEFREGIGRLDRLVRWLQPSATCFVGLGGWRAAFGSRARPGAQAQLVGGRPVYVMPSTSGLNARTTLSDLTAHLRDAIALADADGTIRSRFDDAAEGPPSFHA
jgi:double-stranded uracil-DNA glycosylase